MTRKPRAALLRLREIALDEARRALRACVDREIETQAEVAAAEAEIQRERNLAASITAGDRAVEAFAAWLPRGRAARETAIEKRCAAELGTMHARSDLAAARAGVEAVKAAIARQDEADRVVAERRAQAVLDEIGQRPKR